MNPYLLVKFSDDLISTTINQPLQSTQRIKYTCFDVSLQYIVLGASSGALYVFNRQPCSFIQLIPNQEGSVTQVRISPNDKIFAFSTHKGLLCTVDYNGSSPDNFNVFREHAGSAITDITWNDQSNEIYAGDNLGKISAVTLSDFIAKTVFQSPCFSLMSLDSQIIQIDWNSNLLLVSTLTRCYVCDTVNEKYRQIGHKLREGEYGACFFRNANLTVPDIAPSENLARNRGIFNSLSETETLPNHSYYENIKLFCARPGSRIWEVRADGTVVKTHQFKQSLATAPRQLVLLEADRYKLPSSTKTYQSQSLNFPKLLNFQSKFILAYRSNGIYVFDPTVSTVVLWTDYFDDILDVRVVGNYVYVLNCDAAAVVLNVVLFTEIEKFVLQCYLNKQYGLCAHLCLSYSDYLEEVIRNENKLQALSNLSDLLRDDELSARIQPFIEKLKACGEKQSAQKLNNGIFIVDNEHFLEKCISNGTKSAYGDKNAESSKTDSVDALKEIGSAMSEKFVSGTKTIKEKWQMFEDKLFNYESSRDEAKNKSKEDDERVASETTPPDDLPEIVPPRSQVTKSNIVLTESQKINKDILMLYEYHKLSGFNKFCDNSSIDNIIKKYSDVRIFFTFVKELETYISQKETDEQTNLCCHYLFLRYIDIDLASFEEILTDEDLKNYLIDAFTKVNASPQYSCACGFPLPSAHKMKIDFENVGFNLIGRLRDRNESYADICRNVPYAWRCVSKVFNVELSLQYGDLHLLDAKMKDFNRSQYRKAVELFINLRNNICLNCGEIFSDENILSWSDFGIILVSNYGAENVIELLAEFADRIPAGELNQSFYQYCIFSSLAESNELDELKLNDLKHRLLSENNFKIKFEKSAEEILLAHRKKDETGLLNLLNELLHL